MCKMYKKLIICLLTLSILFCAYPASATGNETSNSLTPDDVLSAIEDGTAQVTFSTFDITKMTAEEINSNPGLKEIASQINYIQTRSLHTDVAIGIGYQTSIQMVGSSDNFVHMSVPIAEIGVVDVLSGGSSDIWTRMYVSESVMWNGTTTDSWPNYIHYSNISAKLGCGENSVFTKTARVFGNNGSAGSINLGAVFGFFASIADYNTLAAILSLLDSMVIPGTNYNSTSYSLTSNLNSRAVGAKWGTGTSLSEHKAELRLESSLSTKNSNLDANVSTVAAAEWEFDVYYSAPIGASPRYQDQKLTPSANYLVNMK